LAGVLLEKHFLQTFFENGKFFKTVLKEMSGYSYTAIRSNYVIKKI